MTLRQSGAHFSLDFTSPQLLYRLQHATLRKEALARAIGISPKQKPIIVDATAGLGRDGFILAALGYELVLLERSLIIFNLLETGLKAAATHPDLLTVVNRLRVVHTEASLWLEHLLPEHYPDIIYLDPMFPERLKTAAVKKESKFLQDIVGFPEDDDKLLQIAERYATKRVVVKRPNSANPLNHKKPDFIIPGKACRFDVYLT